MQKRNTVCRMRQYTKSVDALIAAIIWVKFLCVNAILWSREDKYNFCQQTLYLCPLSHCALVEHDSFQGVIKMDRLRWGFQKELQMATVGRPCRHSLYHQLQSLKKWDSMDIRNWRIRSQNQFSKSLQAPCFRAYAVRPKRASCCHRCGISSTSIQSSKQTNQV